MTLTKKAARELTNSELATAIETAGAASNRAYCAGEDQTEFEAELDLLFAEHDRREKGEDDAALMPPREVRGFGGADIDLIRTHWAALNEIPGDPDNHLPYVWVPDGNNGIDRLQTALDALRWAVDSMQDSGQTDHPLFERFVTLRLELLEPLNIFEHGPCPKVPDELRGEAFACPECGGTEFTRSIHGWDETSVRIERTTNGLEWVALKPSEFTQDDDCVICCTACDNADFNIDVDNERRGTE